MINPALKANIEEGEINVALEVIATYSGKISCLERSSLVQDEKIFLKENPENLADYLSLIRELYEKEHQAGYYNADDCSLGAYLYLISDFCCINKEVEDLFCHIIINQEKDSFTFSRIVSFLLLPHDMKGDIIFKLDFKFLKILSNCHIIQMD